MGLLDALFPVNCLGCGKSGKYICEGCIKKQYISLQICSMCGKSSIDGFTHIKCKKPLGLDGLVCLWEYRRVIRKVLLGMKYKYASDVAKELSDLAGEFLKTQTHALPKEAVLVPIPLFKKRENWRGFNQSALIGKLVADEMGWGFNDEILIRKKFTKPQTELKGDERRKNMKGVFGFTKDYRLPTTDHRPLILFDDVYTTGSTLKEACKVLKRNGAKRVWGLTIAS